MIRPEKEQEINDFANEIIQEFVKHGFLSGEAFECLARASKPIENYVKETALNVPLQPPAEATANVPSPEKESKKENKK